MVKKLFILIVFCLIVYETLRCNARNVNSYEKIGARFTRQIAPGTKWCGNGDKATNDQDFGYFRKTDECCRKHDKCPLNIGGGQERYGLKNPDRFTRSHCDCDKEFYECLVDAATRASRTIGEIYFNFVGKKCFRDKLCPQEIICKKQYEWVNGTSWLPTEDELKKLYQLIALIIPELEIDPFEDYILGRIDNRNSSNATRNG